MTKDRPFKGYSIIEKLDDYTVIDLETTGKYVNKCEIIELAAVKVRNNNVVDTYSQLVQPFRIIPSQITDITGITNEMVEECPKIEDVIEEYMRFIGDDIILGHNIATFDSVILYDLCERLNLPHFCNNMLDTVPYARHCDIIVPDYKLTTLTSYFGIEHSNAHRALGDCLANHECYQKLKETFDGTYRATRRQSKRSEVHFSKISEDTKRLNELVGIVKGVMADNKLEESEILYLDNWVSQNEQLSGNYPFDIISEAFKDILEDGVITEDEKLSLMSILSEFDDPVSNRSCNIENDDLSGANAVLTGDFACGSKEYVAEKLESIGVNVQNSVLKSTNYVIVGSLGSTKWAQGNYGSKVKKALEMQQNGSSIKVVKEDDFFRCFEQQKGQTIIGINSIFNRINHEIVSEQRIPESVLHLETNEDGQNKSESVWIKEPLTGKKSKLIFNCYMRGRKNDRYATFVINNNSLKAATLPDNVEIKTLSSDKSHTYINIKEIDSEFELFLKRIISFSIQSFEPSDKFGCCGKYKECSQAKECLHDDLFYSKACYYRKNLESGKIFY